MFKPSHSPEHSVLAVVPREKLTKNTNHIPSCCFLSIYKLYFSCIFFILEIHSANLISGYRHQGACSVKVHNDSHSVCSCWHRMLYFGAFSSTGQRSSVKNPCLDHSLTILADGLVSDVASALSSENKIKSCHIGQSGPRKCLYSWIYKPCAPLSGGCSTTSEAGTCLPIQIISPQRKMTLGTDNNRMGRARWAISWPSPLFHIESLPETRTRKEGKKAYLRLPSAECTYSLWSRWKYWSIYLNPSHLKRKTEK